VNGSLKKIKNNNYILVFLLLVISSCGAGKYLINEVEYVNTYNFSDEIEDKIAVDTVPWKYQISASDYATKGDYLNALRSWDLAFQPRETSFSVYQIDSINALSKKVDAREYIIAKAKSEQIIIINEAHHSSLNRFFVKSLLKDLHDKGFTNLGLEALGNGKDYLDSLLNFRNYPIQASGWYTKDPQFGNLVRDALEIGYDLFPYEQTNDSNNRQREIEQAKNIHTYIQKNPNEKFLIYCGFDHVLEGVHSSWEKAMAERVKEYTGINPFTINQVVFNEKSEIKFNPPFLKAISPKIATVLVDTNNVTFTSLRNDSYTDIVVFHPISEFENGRPSWLFTQGNRKVKIDLSNLQLSYPLMILAYKKGELIKEAIPLDICEVQSENELCFLALKPGNYTIVVTNGKFAKEYEKKVK